MHLAGEWVHSLLNPRLFGSRRLVFEIPFSPWCSASFLLGLHGAHNKNEMVTVRHYRFGGHARAHHLGVLDR